MKVEFENHHKELDKKRNPECLLAYEHCFIKSVKMWEDVILEHQHKEHELIPDSRMESESSSSLR